MKPINCIFSLGKIAIAFFILASCTTAPVSTTKSPNITSSSTTTLIPGPSLSAAVTTISPQDLYTPIPTLSNQSLELVAGLLQSKDCELPCYLGITPGETTLGQAEAILIGLGASHKGDYDRKDGSKEYDYTLMIGRSSGNNTISGPNNNTIDIFHHVDLITNNDTVQVIEIGVGTPKLPESLILFREYWSKFSAREIFLQMGMPDQLYIDVTDPSLAEQGRYLLFDYEKRGAVIQLYGARQENNICPESEAEFIDLKLSLFVPGTSLDIYNGRVPPTDRSAWLPIKDVLGINSEEFYQKVFSNTSMCFKPKQRES